MKTCSIGYYTAWYKHGFVMDEFSSNSTIHITINIRNIQLMNLHTAIIHEIFPQDFDEKYPFLPTALVALIQLYDAI
jgi:hypothetical protein